MKNIIEDAKTLYTLGKIKRVYKKHKKEIMREVQQEKLNREAAEKEQARLDRINNCKIEVGKLVW